MGEDLLHLSDSEAVFLYKGTGGMLQSVFATTIIPIMTQTVLKIQHLQHTVTTDAQLSSENLARLRGDTLRRRLRDSLMNYN